MILITRPINDAIELQKQLKKKNIQSLIDPLTSFKFINRKIKLNENDICICASQRCVESLVRLKNINNISLIVVGIKVEKLLRKNNFKKILFTALDTKELIKWMRKKNNQDRHYIYLSGSIANDEFITDLKKFKISFRRKIIYQTIFKKTFNRDTIKNLKQNKITGVVFYSKSSVKTYFRLLKKYNMTHFSDNQLFFALSLRISEPLKKYKFRSSVVKISPKPEQRSMISLIAKSKRLI